jgi:DNA (cytosine-5)-methyltransferase 1
MILVLSLFPGIGMLDMAFEAEGFCVVRGPDLLWGGDVHRFHPPTGRFDGVIGGPPCQAFSALNNISKAHRVNLIPEFERVVHEAQPAWFLMENVRAAPLPRVDGYFLHFQLFNNRWTGASQNRLRRLSFGARERTRLHLPTAALEDVQWKAAVTSAHGGERRTHFNRSTGGKIQRYTVEQALEAQGLPADFFQRFHVRGCLTREAQLRVIANGVPLPMGRAIAHAVKLAIKGRSADGV